MKKTMYLNRIEPCVHFDPGFYFRHGGTVEGNLEEEGPAMLWCQLRAIDTAGSGVDMCITGIKSELDRAFFLGIADRYNYEVIE